MRPALNSTSGPSLVLVSEYPYPKYKTVYPVLLTANKSQSVIITFLAQDASKVVASCISLGDVSATVEPLLTRTDVEVWTATVNAIGFVPLGSVISSGSIILELSSLTQKTVVEIEVQTTPEPKSTGFGSASAAVPLSISRSQAPQTPVNRSFRDTMGQSVGNDYSMY